MKCERFDEVKEARKDLLLSFIPAASEKISEEDFILMVYYMIKYIEQLEQCLECESLCQFTKSIPMEEFEKIV